jgi:hypothetical protein
VIAERVFDLSHRLAWLTDAAAADGVPILGPRNIPAHMAHLRKLVPGSRDFK